VTVREFICEGCGAYVHDARLYDGPPVPPHGLCAICEWLCEHITDPEVMVALHKRLAQ
jgi:hypothetical protein